MGARRHITRHEELRRRAGYTVTALARELDFNHAYISRIEGGQVRPSARYREAFARLIGVAEELVFDEQGTAA